MQGMKLVGLKAVMFFGFVSVCVSLQAVTPLSAELPDNEPPTRTALGKKLAVRGLLFGVPMFLCRLQMEPRRGHGHYGVYLANPEHAGYFGVLAILGGVAIVDALVDHNERSRAVLGLTDNSTGFPDTVHGPADEFAPVATVHNDVDKLPMTERVRRFFGRKQQA